ncbi:S9 family peptidase [Halosegnis marinus]|uniref:S9 family peptidase n=1 Tax=Halosegnis marinus TaxID=3034023 RepID=A0ABD5ZML0_9EURY|nr:prolyl oligopeptidase family serine peptidase [Halosegnis sp. DT85]
MSLHDVDNVLEELAGLPSFHHPTVSPDGSTVAVYYDGSGRNELHFIDTETGESEQVTDGEVPRNARWYLKWGTDEEVFFHMDEGGNEQNDIHVADRDGNVEPVVEQEGQNSLQAVSDDGRVLYFGSSRDGQMNIYRHDRDAGETTKLTEYERAAGGATLSPDGDRVAFSTNESDDYDNQDVYVMDADGSNPRNLEIGEDGAEASPSDFSPDGSKLLVSDNTEDLGRPGVYDFETGETTWYGADDAEESPVCFLDDGERFLAHRTRDAAVVPVVYDLSGGSRELDLPEGVAAFSGTGKTQIDDDRLLVTNTTPSTRSSLLAYDLADDSTETLLAADYGPFSPDDFADAEYFTFDSDGVPETRQAAVEHEPYEELEIGGLLYDSGERPSPLIVNPHGGPRAADYRNFDLYTQFLVSRGFSVLKVNYRGSTGRGREFVETLYDDWGGAEQGDVATGAEHVLAEHDYLDADRVVVFGGSYGGYSAYWQTVQYPDLYAAGIAWIGLTDLEEMFETTMPHFRTELMEKNLGTPEENPDLYRERSPIEYAENLACPLLMVHGVNDRRVPVSQARMYDEKLQELGYEKGEDGDYEYVELGEEGHASSDIDQKIRLFRVLDDFLARRVGTTVGAPADD